MAAPLKPRGVPWTSELLLNHAVPSDSGCMEWTRSRNPDGYGMITQADGHRGLATRLLWTLLSGQAIPPRMIICHKCDNPPCINPAHLYLGTSSQNGKDAWNRGRHPKKHKGHAHLNRAMELGTNSFDR